ncbi:MAG: ATP-binding protein [Flammeovirgaceae bacterium]|nr:MAG: ATP-binding protein [Flammeovirgaceae bacterium]
MPELFSKSKLMGTFKGFSERGFEFAAEIVTPYNSEMQDRPQLGQFLLIQLATPEEASLGRITKFVPSGLLASAEGEDYINTMQEREQDVPEDLKKQKLKYKVQIKLLGAVKNIKVRETIEGREREVEKIIFVPSQRRLPHLGAKVALPSDSVLRELCQLSGGTTDLGDYVLGEFVFSGRTSSPESMLRQINPELKVTFNINNLVSKRSVVFARAGYGKSNLIKYLISELYRGGIPQTQNRHNAGVLIFDADGEYFWPNISNNRPGLCDVPQLRDRIIVFTNRTGINPYYQSWKAGEVRLDIRELPARDVIGIAISSERQDNQNVIKLKSLNDTNWRLLVDLIARDGLGAADAEVGRLLGYQGQQIQNASAEINAAKSNMFNVVRHLHDPHSTLINGTLEALRNGFVVVVDISMLSSTAGYNIAGLLMRRIFSFNQENFTGTTAPIPVISIIEEAQSVLGRSLEESSPFVEWVKEGRKYDLGAILVTQQPGSMAPELLSQADNWFCFHLLSEGDAGTLGKYNSHYSHDILAHLIGEPIQGNCYMWSAPKQPFVLPVRIRSFEELYIPEIRQDETEAAYGNSPAIEIRNRATQVFNELATSLRQKLGQKTLNTHYFEDNTLKGIYVGQLFRIIEEILNELGTEVFYDANQLKPILLARMFEIDVDELTTHRHENREYLCCQAELWHNIQL